MAKLFQIPTIQEVVDFFQQKQAQWPGSFCEWYGIKFWNYYQQTGWQLKKNIMMRDWHAAYYANWKDLKYDAKEKLAECLKTEDKPKAQVIDMETRVRLIYEAFKSGRIDKTAMSSVYKWLFINKKFNFTRAEFDKLVADAGNEKDRGRYLAVKLYFTKLINQENDKLGSNPVSGAAAGRII